MVPDLNDILNFWFTEVGADRWFDADPNLDQAMRHNFQATYDMAARGELRKWEETPEGLLALLLLLDHFPKRMFRGTAQAYATDEMALDLARVAIIKHFDDKIDRQFKLFFYLPFHNSEYMGDQRLAIFYIRERVKNDDWLTMAEHNLNMIQRFGRFPDRNQALGRTPTPEEEDYLNHKPAVKTLSVPVGLDAALAMGGAPA